MNLNAPYPLTPAQIAQFRRDGFIKLKEVHDADSMVHYGSAITHLTIELNTQNLP